MSGNQNQLQASLKWPVDSYAPAVGLVMARVRQNGEFFLINSLIGFSAIQ